MSALALGQCLLPPTTLWAAVPGDYIKSAHASSAYGVKRSSMTSGISSEPDYATGNCAHCHEMHASLAAEEPAPDNFGPSPYTLFANNFNTAATTKPYGQTDNFCFYCHSGSTPVSIQPVTNTDYSTRFGGGTSTTPDDIMEAFNQDGRGSQASYHNLSDIHTFVNVVKAVDFPWYTDYSNPCNGCHNPHLAKRNYESSSPHSSAISKPSDHFNLWGETQLMSTYSGGGAYIPPYSNAPAREPYGSTIIEDGSITPNYVEFCMDCHNSNNNIDSTTLGTVRDINWSFSGEKHGSLPRNGILDIREPYFSAQANTNFVLSCLDCHEPHGSPNIMLLRQRVNGESTIDPDVIATTNNMSNLCKRCHTDDAEANAGTKIAGKWRYIHHESTDKPYPGPPKPCDQCHKYGIPEPGGQAKIPCGNCHFHGSDDRWLGTVGVSAYQTDRKTF